MLPGSCRNIFFTLDPLEREVRPLKIRGVNANFEAGNGLQIIRPRRKKASRGIVDLCVPELNAVVPQGRLQSGKFRGISAAPENFERVVGHGELYGHGMPFTVNRALTI